MVYLNTCVWCMYTCVCMMYEHLYVHGVCALYVCMEYVNLCVYGVYALVCVYGFCALVCVHMCVYRFIHRGQRKTPSVLLKQSLPYSPMTWPRALDLELGW